jgi:gas vesicle protein
MKKFLNFLFGAFFGGLTGATLALLFAPMKGEELRQKLNEYIVEVKGEVSEATIQKKAELEKELSKFRKTSTEK